MTTSRITLLKLGYRMSFRSLRRLLAGGWLRVRRILPSAATLCWGVSPSSWVSDPSIYNRITMFRCATATVSLILFISVSVEFVIRSSLDRPFNRPYNRALDTIALQDSSLSINKVALQRNSFGLSYKTRVLLGGMAFSLTCLFIRYDDYNAATLVDSDCYVGPFTVSVS